MSPVKSPDHPSIQDIGKRDKIVVKKDELPLGWTMEVKTRKAGSANKTDRFYTDPVTGYVFRSFKDVQRYLKTGKVGRLASKPKNNECVDTDNKDSKDERLHEQMSETLGRKRLMDKTRSTFGETGESDLLHRASKRLAPLPPSPPEPKTRQATRLAGIKADTPSPLLLEPKSRQATPLAGTGIVQLPPPQPEPKTRQPKRLSGIIDNAPPASPPQPITRRATRQAGIKIDSPPPSPPDTRNSRQATRSKLVNVKKTEAEKMTDKPNENADMDNNPDHNPKEHSKQIEMGPAVANPAVSNQIPQDPSINFSLNDLWTDPCIEFAVKTLTGAIPCGDLNKAENPSPSPLKVPLEELWTDPCIEFAVKTLTGAIPVGEDEYLQQQPTTSRNTRAPHDFYPPSAGTSFCQTGWNKQQQDLTFGNGGLQKSGNIVNGQCSTSKLF